MLSDEFIAVSASRSTADFHNATMRFMRTLGFSRMGAVAVVDKSMDKPLFRGVDNAPPEYRDSFEDLDCGRRDPVMQHCKHSWRPIVWDQHTYVDAGCSDKWDAQAVHGYKTGIACALHLAGGRHFFIGLDRDRPLPRNKKEVTRLVADLQLFTVLAQESAFQILWPAERKLSEVPKLTPRETECLRWTMDGKTAWEVGRILGISEQTAVRHVTSASHKLGCISKHQAVVKALRLGLIT